MKFPRILGKSTEKHQRQSRGTGQTPRELFNKNQGLSPEWDKLPRIDQASLEEIAEFPRASPISLPGVGLFSQRSWHGFPGNEPGESRARCFPRIPRRSSGAFPAKAREISGGMDSRASLKDTLGCTLRNPQPFSDEFPAKAHKKTRGVLGKSRGKAQGIPAKIIENPWGIRPKTNSGIESWEMPLRICPGRCSGVLLGFPKDFPGKSRQKPGKFAWIPVDCPGRCSGVPPGVCQPSPKDFPGKSR